MATTTLLNFPKLPERGPEFHRALVKMAQRIQRDPSLIAMVMSIESRFDPQAVNKSTGASGLIQIMPQYAADGRQPIFKYTIAEIRAMDAIQQLELVEQVFARQHNLSLPRDYYASVFFPAAVGKPLDYLIGEQGNTNPISSGSKLTYDTVYTRNKGLDANNDGRIIVGDLEQKTNSILAAAAGRPPIVVTDEEPMTADPSAPTPQQVADATWKRVLSFVAGGGIGFWLTRLFGVSKKK